MTAWTEQELESPDPPPLVNTDFIVECARVKIPTYLFHGTGYSLGTRVYTCTGHGSEEARKCENEQQYKSIPQRKTEESTIV